MPVLLRPFLPRVRTPLTTDPSDRQTKARRRKRKLLWFVCNGLLPEQRRHERPLSRSASITVYDEVGSGAERLLPSSRPSPLLWRVSDSDPSATSGLGLRTSVRKPPREETAGRHDAGGGLTRYCGLRAWGFLRARLWFRLAAVPTLRLALVAAMMVRGGGERSNLADKERPGATGARVGR